MDISTLEAVVPRKKQYKDIRVLLRNVAAMYPAGRGEHQLAHLPRMAFNLELASRGVDVENSRLLDLGGGICMFTPGCAALGFAETVLVDDFQDPINRKLGETIFKAHRELGVKIVTSDLTRDGLSKADGTFDVITMFEYLEHIHHAPRKILRQAVERLRPSGRLIISVPNCVNLRKRITSLFGRNDWSSLDSWYHQEVFRDHVREPSVKDLLHIGADLGLERLQIYGRNFMGYESENVLIRTLTPIFDRVLTLRPTLCSNLFLVGYKS